MEAHQHPALRPDAPPVKFNRHGQEIKEFVVRLDVGLYESVRVRSDADRMSMADVVRNALRRYCA